MPNARPRKLLGEEARTDFKRFEVLLVAVGSISIIASAIISYRASGSVLEFIGQLLMLPVLLIAIQYGWVGAIVATISSTMIYAVVRSPDALDTLMTGTVLQLLGVRALSYFIVGFIGSRVAMTIKYYFARSGGLGGVDPGSGVYTVDFIKGMIEKQINEYERYNGVFSVVIIELAPEVLRKGDKFRGGRTFKGLGALLKNNTRVADDVGRYGMTSFALLLPHTGIEGAKIMAGRMAGRIAEYFGAFVEDGVGAMVYSVPEHLRELRDLVGMEAVDLA